MMQSYMKVGTDMSSPYSFSIHFSISQMLPAISMVNYKHRIAFGGVEEQALP